jgi:hypothetical protein
MLRDQVVGQDEIRSDDVSIFPEFVAEPDQRKLFKYFN